MSYSMIVDAIAKIESAKSWKTVLITYNHVSAPNEFTSHSFTFADSQLRTDLIKDMSTSFLKVVNEFGQTIQEYSGMNSKKVVDRIETSSELISICWQSLIRSISISDDATPLKDITANAFVFIGTYSEKTKDENIYFISRKNPIMNLRKGRRKGNILAARENSVSEVSEPLLQFGRCFDAIVYKNVLYMINDNCETIFNVEYSRKTICKARLEEIEKATVVYDMDAYREYALSGQTSYKFISFNGNTFVNVCKPEGRKLLHEKFHIPIKEGTNQFDLSDVLNAKNFTAIICGKTKQELFEEIFCEVPSSSPMVIPK